MKNCWNTTRPVAKVDLTTGTGDDSIGCYVAVQVSGAVDVNRRDRVTIKSFSKGFRTASGR